MVTVVDVLNVGENVSSEYTYGTVPESAKAIPPMNDGAVVTTDATVDDDVAYDDVYADTDIDVISAAIRCNVMVYTPSSVELIVSTCVVTIIGTTSDDRPVVGTRRLVPFHIIVVTVPTVPYVMLTVYES